MCESFSDSKDGNWRSNHDQKTTQNTASVTSAVLRMVWTAGTPQREGLNTTCPQGDAAVDKIWDFAEGRCPSLKAANDAFPQNRGSTSDPVFTGLLCRVSSGT